MRNRQDRLIPNSAGHGVRCDWEHTRQLHLCNVFPFTGRWLLQRALRDWPIQFQDAPQQVTVDKACWNGAGGEVGGTSVDRASAGGGGKSPKAGDSPPVTQGRGSGTRHSGLRAWGSDSALRPTDARTHGSADPPSVSFLIGHRGEERLPLLLTTLKSIGAQEGVAFECIVVEQDVEPRVRDRLPRWVRYLHTPPRDQAMPYCRSWTFNLAARAARGEMLICHDNDMVVPAGYAQSVLSLAASGCDVIQPKRFVFYLSEQSSVARSPDGSVPDGCLCEQVIENLEGGGSLAIARDAYFAIGGMDEEFLGWGGEDVEFWDRCQTLRVYPYGYLPLLHLWHAAAPKKASGDRNSDLMSRRLGVPAPVRIRALLEGSRLSPPLASGRGSGLPQHSRACTPSRASVGRHSPC